MTAVITPSGKAVVIFLRLFSLAPSTTILFFHFLRFSGTGILRVLYYGKETAYYMNQPVFWMKMAVFLVVGTLSLYPTISFLGWIKSLTQEKPPEITLNKYKRLKYIIIVELCGFTLIPLLASMMARGIGTQWFSS